MTDQKPMMADVGPILRALYRERGIARGAQLASPANDYLRWLEEMVDLLRGAHANRPRIARAIVDEAAKAVERALADDQMSAFARYNLMLLTAEEIADKYGEPE